MVVVEEEDEVDREEESLSRLMHYICDRRRKRGRASRRYDPLSSYTLSRLIEIVISGFIIRFAMELEGILALPSSSSMIVIIMLS